MTDAANKKKKDVTLETLEWKIQNLIYDISYLEDQLDERRGGLGDDQRKVLTSVLEIAREKLKINGLELHIYASKIELESATTDEERRLKDQQIEAKEQEKTAHTLVLHDLKVQLRSFEAQEIQPGTHIHIVLLLRNF